MNDTELYQFQTLMLTFVDVISVAKLLINEDSVQIRNRRQRKQKGHSRTNDPEKLATLNEQDTRRRQTKHNTICVEHHNAQTHPY